MPENRSHFNDWLPAHQRLTRRPSGHDIRPGSFRVQVVVLTPAGLSESAIADCLHGVGRTEPVSVAQAPTYLFVSYELAAANLRAACQAIVERLIRERVAFSVLQGIDHHAGAHMQVTSANGQLHWSQRHVRRGPRPLAG